MASAYDNRHVTLHLSVESTLAIQVCQSSLVVMISCSSITTFRLSFINCPFSLAFSCFCSLSFSSSHNLLITTRHLPFVTRLVHCQSSVFNSHFAICLQSILNQRLSQQRKPSSSRMTRLHIYKVRGSTPYVCVPWFTLVVMFLFKYTSRRLPCETCLGVKRFRTLGWFILCHAATDEVMGIFPMPLQVIKTLALSDEDQRSSCDCVTSQAHST